MTALSKLIQKKNHNEEVEKKYQLSSTLKQLREEHGMPTKPLDPSYCIKYLESIDFGEEDATQAGYYKALKKIKKYLQKYIYQLDDGTYVMFDVVDRMKTTLIADADKTTTKRTVVFERDIVWRKIEKLSLITNMIFRMVGDYKKKLNVMKKSIYDDLIVWLKTEKTLYRLTVDLNEPIIFNRNGIQYINLCNRFKHHYNPKKKYEDFPEHIKKGCEMYLNFVKDIICSGDEQQFLYDTFHTANLCQGGKNQSIYLLYGEQGIGKSTKLDMLYLHIIGTDVSIVSGPSPLTTGFDIELLGKLLVIFEELPSSTSSQWVASNDKLKALTTCEFFSYVEKGKTPILALNINNIYIATNNRTAVKENDGRRIFAPDISHKYKGNKLFWKEQREAFMNDEVGEALFYYYNEIDLTKYPVIKGYDKNKEIIVEYEEFNSINSIPDTNMKAEFISERLDGARKFIRDEYILKNRGIEKIEAYEMYENYRITTQDDKKLSDRRFYSTLRNVGIEVKPSTGNKLYVQPMELSKLQSIAEKEKWITDTDRYNAVLKQEQTDNEITHAQYRITYVEDLEKQLKELKSQISKLQFQTQIIQQESESESDNESDEESDNESKVVLQKGMRSDKKKRLKIMNSIIEEAERENKELLEMFNSKAKEVLKPIQTDLFADEM